jgi:hypothetical protein
MPHPDLPELYRRIRVAIARGATQAAIQQTGALIANRILLKHQRLLVREGIRIDNWARIARNAPTQIPGLFVQIRFSVLQRRDADIVFHYNTRAQTLYCVHYGIGVETVRTAQRILLENPLVALANSKVGIQSWSRPSSISLTYNRHLTTSRVPNKSRFLADVDILALELVMFEQAWGLLDSADQIFLYARFGTNIGRLPNGRLTPLVKMQCDRISRSSGTGTKTEIHCYPISLADLRVDFAQATRPFINHVQTNVLVVP